MNLRASIFIVECHAPFTNISYSKVHPLAAIHLAHWISPISAVKVTRWVAGYISDDIFLVPELVSRHDMANNTTDRVAVAKASNELLEMETRIAALKRENEQLAFRQKLELQACECRAKQLENDGNALWNREKNLTLEKREVEQKLDLEDLVIKRKRVQLQATKSAEDNPVTPTNLTPPENVFLQNKDLTTLAAELGFRCVPSETLSAIGSIISAGYRNRYGMRPPKRRKMCNGSNRFVDVYTDRDYGWIRDILRDELPKFVGVPESRVLLRPVRQTARGGNTRYCV